MVYCGFIFKRFKEGFTFFLPCNTTIITNKTAAKLRLEKTIKGRFLIRLASKNLNVWNFRTLVFKEILLALIISSIF